MGYKVLAPEVTVHRAMRELTDANGAPAGFQLGLGKTYVEGQIIPDELFNPKMAAALEDPNDPSHEYVASLVEETSEVQAQGPAIPFAGFDDQDVNDIIAVMRNLPSATVRQWIAYEVANANRPEIAGFSIGFGESPASRQTGAVSSEVPADHDPTEKPSADIVTRPTPPPADQIVPVGEGVTGTGDGRTDHETAEASAGESEESSDEDDGDDKPKRTTTRRRTTRKTTR